MSLDFDGVDDKVDHGDIAAIDGAVNFTAMCWIFPDVNPTNARGAIFVKASDSPTILAGSSTNANNVSSRPDASGAGAIAYTDANTFPLSTWNHVAMAWDGNGVGDAAKLKFYKNGTLITTNMNPGGLPAVFPSSAESLFVGGKTAFTFWDGKIAVVKMWSVTLTAAEIAQEVNSYRPVRTANLISWAPYDDGTSAKDYSGSGNHGTVTGALQFQGPPVEYGGKVASFIT